MVDVNTKLSLRGQRARERLQKIAEVTPPTGVRVTPKNEELRKVLKHPRGGAFGQSGSAEWPNDRFTQRRIAEGDVTVEGGEQQQQQQKGVRGGAGSSGGGGTA